MSDDDWVPYCYTTDGVPSLVVYPGEILVLLASAVATYKHTKEARGGTATWQCFTWLMLAFASAIAAST